MATAFGVLQQAAEVGHGRRQAEAEHRQRQGDEQQRGQQLEEVHGVRACDPGNGS
jgi:hypothetical protein